MAEDEENKGIVPAGAASVADGGSVDASLTDRGARGLSDAEQRRRMRAAVKLRENLARRKQQSRARRAGEAENGEGLPAAHAPASALVAADGPVAGPVPGVSPSVAGAEPVNASPAANSSKPDD